MPRDPHDIDPHPASVTALANAARDADLTLWLPGDVPMLFRRIPAAPSGFLMGERGGDSNAEPVHRVIVDRCFYLGMFPVTQLQYRVVAASSPELGIAPDPSLYKGDEHPVHGVSWGDAMTWCRSLEKGPRELTLRDRIVLKAQVERVALPSEAQWEYACRAGRRGESSAGEGEARLREQAWFGEKSGQGSTHVVGQKSANAFGLYDMHGNVSEWCEDVWDSRAYRKREDCWLARGWTLVDAGEDARNYGRPRKRDEAADHVVRGGSWLFPAARCRSACRSWWGPVNRYGNTGFLLGFRVCLLAQVE